MKDKYSEMFAVTANTHDIEFHDAILVQAAATGGAGVASWEAQLFPYGKAATQRNRKGDPIVKGGAQDSNYDPATGPVFYAFGNTYDHQTIYPFQVKSVGYITNANVFALRR